MKKVSLLILALVLCVSILAACGPKENPGLDKASTYLNNLYKDEAETTPSDYEVVGAVMVDDVKYTVTWTVDNEAIKIEPKDNGMVLINVDEKSATDVTYKLTATITDAEGNTAVREYTRKVPAYKVNTWDEYVAAKPGDIVVVKGVVNGIVSKSQGSASNSIYFQDEVGGYYVYNIEKDPITEMGLKIGMTVEVKGKRDNYNGTHEIIEASVEILDTTAKEVTPVDYTEIYKNAADLKAEALASKQGLLVTIKGVEITGQGDNGYYKFKLGDKESYVRISSSNNCISKEDQAKFIATHTEKFGYQADVTGLVTVYNGAFYLSPVSADAFTNITLPERTDKEKLDLEVGNIVIPGKITENTTITLPLAGTTYNTVTFAWASDNACAVVESGKLKVTLPEEAATVKLTLTATCGTETATKEFEIKVDAASTDVYVPESVTAPTAGTAYKFFLTQGKLGGKNLYITGEVDGRYLVTTDKADQAVDVYVEAVEGGFKFYILVGEEKQYITIYKNSDNKDSVKFDKDGTCVYTYNAEVNAWSTKFDNTDYYLGTYSTYSTVSASKLSFITAENTGKDQFPAGLATLAPAVLAPEAATAPTAGTAYKFFLTQGKLGGKNLYITGEVDGRYLVTTDKADQAVDVYVEAVEGGFKFYILVGEEKQYITIYKNSDNKDSVKFDKDGTCVYTYNAEVNAWSTKFDNTDYYLGTYSTYSTVSASKLSFITAENTGKDQFPAGLATLTAKKVAPVANKAPTAGTAYKFFLTQGKLGGKNLYITGEVDGRYLVTTDKISKAIDVYAEAVEGGFKFYILVGEEKQYITIYKNSDNKDSVKFDKDGTCVYTYNAEVNAWSTKFDNTDYYLGTYSTYSTVSASKLSFITAENTGKDQFPAGLATIEIVADNAGGETGGETGGTTGGETGGTTGGETGGTTGGETGGTTGGETGGTTGGETGGTTGGETGGQTPTTNITLSFASADNRTSCTADQQVWAQNGIKVTNDKAESTSDVKDYTNPVRFYANTKVTVEYTGMTKIQFVCNTATYASNLQSSIAAADGVTVTVDDKTVTVTFASAVNSFVVAKLSAQVRVDSIAVYNA